ncbi:hypothetical protein LTR08_006505 [Meristemomyces frigidus]|nr:hypothetical protein LTR08_006505 [Meristemomyces frigidus]
MAPPNRAPALSKTQFPGVFKQFKPAVFSESLGPRPSGLIQKIAAVSWSPTGALIATCTSASIRVWSAERPNVRSSTELKNAHAKGGATFGSPGVSGEVIDTLAFCPTTEGVLASSGRDGLIRLWDVRVPGTVAHVGGKGMALADCKIGGEGHFLKWHPNGREMLVGRHRDQIYSVDIRRVTALDATPVYSMESTERIHRASKNYYDMSFSNTGREIFATAEGGSVDIIDYPSMTRLHTLKGHPETTYAVQQSPAGTCVAVGGADANISLWSTHDWYCMHTLSAPGQLMSVKDLSFSFDGAYLVAGCGDAARDGTPGIPIYHVDTGEVVHTVETVNCPTFVAWHPTQYHVAYAGDPGGLKVVGKPAEAV